MLPLFLLLLLISQVMYDSLRPDGLQHARFPCLSPSPGMCPSSCPIESVKPSNLRILCGPLLLLPSIFPSIRVFSNESAVWIRWPKYWSFSFSIRPSKECSGLISLKTDWFDLFHQIIYFCFQSLKSEISWVIVSNMGNFCLRIRLNKHRSELEVNIQICKIVNYW